MQVVTLVQHEWVFLVYRGGFHQEVFILQLLLLVVGDMLISLECKSAYSWQCFTGVNVCTFLRQHNNQ